MLAETFETATITAAFAWLWTQQLTRPGEIFSFIRHHTQGAPAIVKKPLLDCAKCFAGQAYIWTTFLKHVSGYATISVSDLPEQAKGLIVCIFVAAITEKWKG